jgi:hypothetical protein
VDIDLRSLVDDKHSNGYNVIDPTVVQQRVREHGERAEDDVHVQEETLHRTGIGRELVRADQKVLDITIDVLMPG